MALLAAQECTLQNILDMKAIVEYEDFEARKSIPDDPTHNIFYRHISKASCSREASIDVHLKPESQNSQTYIMIFLLCVL